MIITINKVTMRHLLLIEDDPVFCRDLKRTLHSWQPDWRFTLAFNGSEATHYLSQTGANGFDLILLDMELPLRNGLSILEEFHKALPFTPFIIITRHGDSESANAAIEKGAFDFLTKPPDEARLRVSINNALQFSSLQQYSERQQRLKKACYTLDDLWGHSAAFHNLVHAARKLGIGGSPLLITGPLGSGKQTLAQAIHGTFAPRQPFQTFSGEELNKTALESALSGTGGTLYIRYIERLSPPLQRLLTRAIPESPMRLMVSTTTNLTQEVAEGNFEESLFVLLYPHRLNMPSLRERDGDVIFFAKRFAAEMSARMKQRLPYLGQEALETLRTYHWPGNIAELQTVISHALIRAEHAASITAAHLFPLRHGRSDDGQAYLHTDGTPRSLAEIEREAIQHALNSCNGHISKAARNLKIGRSTLYRKMAVHGIEPVNTFFRGKIIKPA